MKKILVSFLLTLVALVSYSQITTYEDFKKASEGLIVYKDVKKGKIDYEKSALRLADLYPLDKHDAITHSMIFDVPGKSAEEIYIEVNNWFVHSFRDGKSVIQLNDKEAGCIIGKGYVKGLGTTAGFSNNSEAAAWVIMRVDIKDEKIRMISTIQSYEVTKSTGVGLVMLGARPQPDRVVEYIPSKCFPYTKKEKGTGSKALTLAHCWIVTISDQLYDALVLGITGFEEDDF